MADFSGWEAALLQQINAPLTKQNVAFLDAWQQSEGGTAANNPLNTTQPASGASDYNSVGVKNYPSPNVGIQATAQTLQNGRYPIILSALRSGNPNSIFTTTGFRQIQTWGTNPLNVQARYNQLAGTNYNLQALASAGSSINKAATKVVPGLGTVESVASNITSGAFWVRAIEVVGGGVMILLGLYLLAKQIGLAPDAPPSVTSAAAKIPVT